MAATKTFVKAFCGIFPVLINTILASHLAPTLETAPRLVSPTTVYDLLSHNPIYTESISKGTDYDKTSDGNSSLYSQNHDDTTFLHQVIEKHESHRSLQTPSYCEGPPATGCQNGMWSSTKCACECISPFCHDAMGQCIIPGGSCPANPWVNCIKGEDCPWWKSSLKAESCTTGNAVPGGVWEIYPSKSQCCSQLFPYSKVCDVKLGTAPPTKYPTISKPPEDEFEIVPIKFTLQGLRDDIKMKEFKAEMKDILTTILADLAERVGDLRITKVEERVSGSGKNRQLKRNNQQLQWEGHWEVEERWLLRDVDFYYNVYVVRQEGRKFGPLIIQELKDAYGEVLEGIQAFTNTEYNELDMNWCTTESGLFSICSFTRSPTLAPTPRRVIRPSPGATQVLSDTTVENTGGGLPVWAIVLIVIICLVLLACIGYFVMASVAREDNEDKVIDNNIYLEEIKSRKPSSRSRGAPSHRSHRSRKSRRSHRSHGESEAQDWHIVVAEDQDNQSAFTGKDPSIFPALTFRSGYDGNRSAPDPSVYHDSGDRPDPEDGPVLMLTNGDDPSVGTSRFRGRGDPPLKPQRDPSMYVDDMGDEPSVRYDQYDAEQPDGDVMRQRSVYMGGEGGEEASMQYDQYDAEQPDGSVARHNSTYMPRSDEESTQYDQYGFRQNEPDAHRMKSMYMGSVTGAEYARGTRDASFYDPNSQYSESGAPEYVRGAQDASICEESFRTQEPESDMDHHSSYSTETGRRKKKDASFYSDGMSRRDNPSYYSEGVSMSGKSSKSKKSNRSKKSSGKKDTKSFRSEPGSKNASSGRKKKNSAMHESLVSSWGEILHAAYDEESVNKRSKSFFH